MRDGPLSREGAPREYQEEMGDGPVVGAERGAGCPHPLLVSQGTGCEWVDDRKVLSAIIHGTRRGLHRVDAPTRWPP